MGQLSFETGRILPRLGDDSAPACGTSANTRRAVVESERADRCAQLRAALHGLVPRAAVSALRVLEIGSGPGHFLEAFASAHVDRFCLGIDYCAERSRRAARKQQRNPNGNLLFLRAEVWEFLDSLPDDLRFDAVFVLFPDPWPKRRHRKYRLISDRFLERLARCTSDGAHLYLRTDAPDYFSEARAQIDANPSWRLAPDIPWAFEQPTVFQSKAVAYQSLVAINVSRAR